MEVEEAVMSGFKKIFHGASVARDGWLYQLDDEKAMVYIVNKVSIKSHYEK